MRAKGRISRNLRLDEQLDKWITIEAVRRGCSASDLVNSLLEEARKQQNSKISDQVINLFKEEIVV